MGTEKIGVRVGKIINRYGVAKHFLLLITDNSLSYEYHSKKIESEGHLDEMYVIRTSVCAEVLDDSETVKAYKGLSQGEKAFRCYKTIYLKVSPIYTAPAIPGTIARVLMFVSLLRGMAYAEGN